ncbi:MAG: class I SAM-dependent methyltransferase [Pseudodesulfovibrio sp.]
MNNRTLDIIKTIPSPDTLWNGAHKIPWNDPTFSARILKEHLSQDHDLASRKQQTIEAQAQWINSHCLSGGPASILDLGCGPGLYSRLLAGDTHQYMGIDFSPASIEYARQKYGVDSQYDFRLGDVVKADFHGPHDVVAMLYGEINVFSPDNCRRILTKGFESLDSGGTLLVEFQNPTAVNAMAQAPKSWTRAEEGGLFSDTPYVCLTESHWFEEQAVSLQCFHVLTEGADEATTYRSTTQAWSIEDLHALLRDIGFAEVSDHDDWPVPDDSLKLLTAVKA